MRLRIFESPLQSRVDDRAEYDRPLSPSQAADALHVAKTIERRAEPYEAAECTREMSHAIDAITRREGQLTLRGLQRYINDPVKRRYEPRSHFVDERNAERAMVVLSDVIVKWANAGRPALATEHKLPLDVTKLRAALDEGSLLDPETARSARAALDALDKGGIPVTWRRIESFGAELEAAVRAEQDRGVQRMRAELLPDPAAGARLDSLERRAEGASSLGKLLSFFSDQGQLARLAASVKPGATRVLGGAV